MQFEIGGNAGATQRNLAHLKGLVPIALHLQDTVGHAARRRRKNNTDRQRSPTVSRQDVFIGGANLGLDGKEFGMTRSDVGNGEIGIAQIGDFSLDCAALAHYDSVKI